MAKKKIVLKGDAVRRYKAKQRIVSIIMFTVVGGIVVPASMFLIVIGMLPTIVTVATERKHRDLAAYSVAPLNAVGLLPPLFKLWQTGHTLDNAISLLLDPFSLLFILGASAVGWACYNGFPPMIEAMLTYRGQRVVRRCTDAQERIITEWGEAVMDRKAMEIEAKKKKILNK